MKILLLDDSAAIQKVVRLGLGAAKDIDLGICSDPSSIKVELQRSQPDLIIASESFAGQNTESLIPDAGHWKERIILLADTSESEKKLRRAGFERVLRKPFRLPEFRQIVSEFKASNLEASFAKPAIDLGHKDDTVSRRFVDEVFAGQKNLADSGPKGQRVTKRPAAAYQNQPTRENAFRGDASHTSENRGPLSGDLDIPELTMDVGALEDVWKQSLSGQTTLPVASQEQADLLERARQLRLSPSDVWSEEGTREEQSHGSDLDMSQPKGRLGLETREYGDSGSEMSMGYNRDLQSRSNNEDHFDSQLSLRSRDLGMSFQKQLNVTDENLGPVSEELRRVQIERVLDERVPTLERRLSSSLKLEIDKYLLESTESLVKSKVESFLNSQWPSLVKNVTQQVKRAVETEYTSRMHSDLVGMQKNLSVELRSELRSEVQSALRNWMGQYSRDVLKEVAREELQKLLDES